MLSILYDLSNDNMPIWMNALGCVILIVFWLPVIIVYFYDELCNKYK